MCGAWHAAAQDADRRAGELINGSDYFTLERMMRSPEARRLSPFMHRLASALTAHYFNRSAEACIHIDSLLRENQAELGTESYMSMAFLMGRNLAGAGRYAEAAEFLDSMAVRMRASGAQGQASGTHLLGAMAE